MLIDTHCHLNFKAFKDDADKIIQETLKENIQVIIVGTQYQTSARAVEYAARYDGVYAAVGLHPVQLHTQTITEKIGPETISFKSRAEKFDEQKYLSLSQHQKVVAIGEIGLDYTISEIRPSIESSKLQKYQQETFIKQIKLAKKLKKPIIVHNRNATEDILKILKSHFNKWQEGDALNGVAHFFSGNFDEAQEFFKLGFLISFTGVITFVPQYEMLIRQVPLEKIMVETDSPYVSPLPYRGKRNEPKNVRFIAQKIADIKGLTLEEVAAQTTLNAKKLFKI